MVLTFYFYNLYICLYIFLIKNVLINPANVKELIPEFYGNDDSFLLNKQGL